MSKDEPSEGAPGPDRADEPVRTGFRRRLHRLLDRRDLAEDTREVLGGMLEMSDRAKTEAVRLIAREARNYLEELKIKEDLLELATSHSLEVNLSLHLKPIAGRASPSKPDRRAERSDDADRRERASGRRPGEGSPSPASKSSTEDRSAAPDDGREAAAEPADDDATG